MSTTAHRCVAGVDVGSTLTKVAVWNGDLLATATGRTEPRYVEAAARLLADALARAGRSPADLAWVVATGYGRRRLPFADREITEITCHARGVHALLPGARTIIDIGGQDAKGIKLGPAGRVANFAMNDKCAAGTGRFLEVMADTLGLPLEELAQRGLAARPAGVSSVCTVFAQQEVAQRLADGVPLEEVLAGLHAALAGRIERMVRRLGVERDVILTGGVAHNPTLRRALEERLGQAVVTPSDPLVTGALGAALLAREASERGEPRRAAPLDGGAAEGRRLTARPVVPAPGTQDAPSRAPAGPVAADPAIIGRFRVPGGAPSRGIAAGVDVGSLFTKAVVLEREQATFVAVRTGADLGAAAEVALARAVGEAGLDRARLGGVVATGFGAAKARGLRQESDITCTARGAARLCPGTTVVIDIGGQGSRVIRLGPTGAVKDFTVTGQCAAGSARVLEIVAHVLGVEVDALGRLSVGAREPAPFAVGCAVFAETEAISLVARGVAPEDLLAGLHRSLAGKILALVRGAGAGGSCTVTGGGARDAGLVAHLREALGAVAVPPEPLVVAALGAALLAASGDV